MSRSGQLSLAAAFCALGLAQMVWGMTETWLCCALALTLATGVAFPRTTLRLLLVTLSCDLVLTFRVADSFTLRLAHLCAGILALRLLMTRLVTRVPWRVPRRALQPMVLYLVVAAISSMRSENLAKSVGYCGWAVFDLVAVFAVLVEASRDEETFRFAMRWWIGGAALGGLMGFIQLGAGFAHLPVPFLQQWVGGYPRINGFNYEPAYFALYLESVAGPLLIYGLVARRRALAAFAGLMLVPAALSMSRSGWLGMALLLGYALLRLGVATRWVAMTSLTLVVGVLVGTVLVTFPADFLSEAPRMAAMALDATETSSSAPRLSMLQQARDVFATEPALGVGLGGYGGYVLSHSGLWVPGQQHDADHVVTTNLWLEIASETGVGGVFAVLWFILTLVTALVQVIRFGPAEEAARAEAFLVGIVLVFAVLYQFNQTLWRLDVWALLAFAWSVPIRAAIQAPVGGRRAAATTPSEALAA